MNDGIWRRLGVALRIASEVVMGCEGVEDLAGFCEVCFECEDACFGVGEVDEVEIEDLDCF